MKRKTYGVSGLMDWTAQIRVGRGCVMVHFTGGALTAYGVTPAKFVTSSAFLQQVIERSDFYRSGRIVLLGMVEVADDAAELARKAAVARRVAVAAGDGGVAAGGAGVADGALAAASVDVAAGGDGADVVDGDGVFCVEVPDRYDAVEYLKEHFADKGYTATSLRTKQAFEAACRECGVRFVFTA